MTQTYRNVSDFSYYLSAFTVSDETWPGEEYPPVSFIQLISLRKSYRIMLPFLFELRVTIRQLLKEVFIGTM